MNAEVNSKVLIDRLFSLLDDWRNLPAYQLERRADIFFALYLGHIIKAKFGQNIDFVVPEFPVRVGAISEELPDANQSFKIDYVAVCEAVKKVYLIELKTDQRSRRGKQDWYLEKAWQINIPKLMDGIIKLYSATAQKRKYGNLVAQLSKMGWLLVAGEACTNTSTEYDIQVVYIQPINPCNADNVISFPEIVTFLGNQNDDLTRRFVQSLQEWTQNPNLKTPLANRADIK